MNPIIIFVVLLAGAVVQSLILHAFFTRFSTPERETFLMGLSTGGYLVSTAFLLLFS